MPPIPTGPKLRPLAPEIRPRSYNRGGLYLAVAIAAACIPFTLKFQANHVPNMANRRWQMLNLQSITGAEAIKRYGQPAQTRDFSLEEGAFTGPRVGLKHFYRQESKDYDEHLKEPTVWSYPEYSMIREMIWKLPDSYLTMWFYQPRAVINLDGNASEILMPQVKENDWIALDNYRVGNDLVANQPAAK